MKALVEAYPKGVEQRDGNGDLPLHCVCDRETNVSVEVLSFLLKAYPESIDNDENKRMALGYLENWARKRSDNDSDEDEDFLDNELITSLIHDAIIGGHLLAVKLFVIAFPQSVLMPDKDGMLPLHHACLNIEYIDIAMVLLDADPESATITDSLGRTPLQLLMPLAKVKDRNGMLPLHFQAAHSKTLTVNFLKFLTAAYPDSILVFLITVECYLSNTHSSTNHCPWTS